MCNNDILPQCFKISSINECPIHRGKNYLYFATAIFIDSLIAVPRANSGCISAHIVANIVCPAIRRKCDSCDSWLSRRFFIAGMNKQDNFFVTLIINQ